MHRGARPRRRPRRTRRDTARHHNRPDAFPAGGPGTRSYRLSGRRSTVPSIAREPTTGRKGDTAELRLRQRPREAGHLAMVAATASKVAHVVRIRLEMKRTSRDLRSGGGTLQNDRAETRVRKRTASPSVPGLAVSAT